MPADAVVRLSNDRAVAARAEGTSVAVMDFTHGEATWRVQRIASSETDGDAGLYLMTMGGETGEEWNSFVYGIAPPDVSRVSLEGLEGQGGQVAAGAWVIALHLKDVKPDDLRWRFIDAAGAILLSGEGIFPPDA